MSTRKTPWGVSETKNCVRVEGEWIYNVYLIMFTYFVKNYFFITLSLVNTLTRTYVPDDEGVTSI